MSKDKYLCPCYKLTKEDIKKAVKNGAGSYKKVKKATNAASRCGHCECEVKKYVKKQLKKQTQQPKPDKAGKSKKRKETDG